MDQKDQILTKFPLLAVGYRGQKSREFCEHFLWIRQTKKSMCFDMLWGLWWSPVPKLDEKYVKNANFDSLNPDIQSRASILCWNIFNDYLWSYTIESDMLACVVACFCIYGNLQYKKFVKNVPNLQILPPPESEISNLVP